MNVSVRSLLFRSFSAAVLAGPLMCVAAGDAAAQTLPDALRDLLANHRRIKAADADFAAAGERAKAAYGGWYPDLDVTASYGYERQIKGNETADTEMPPREAKAEVTQLLWDFGSTNAGIDIAKLGAEQARVARGGTEQAVMLEGITAYLDLLRRQQLLGFAKGSEDNIKRQTELEDARVQRGSGFSTDVLQAKQQLAGASAARLRAEGALIQAQSRYTAVFYKAPPADNVGLVRPRVPVDRLPSSLDEVIDIALKNNPNLRAAQLASQIARATISKTKADELAPTVNLIGEAGYKRDFDGTKGNKVEEGVKVEMKYNFDLGFTAVNTLRVSQFGLEAVENRYADARQTVTEQARNAWQSLITARLNAEQLGNQANIAAEFLELARKERQLGRRSLIDVLAGETALINASSDAASAETDVAVAAFQLLTIMGALSLDDLK